MPAILGGFLIFLYLIYRVTLIKQKYTFIQAFRSVLGCQTCVSKRGK